MKLTCLKHLKINFNVSFIDINFRMKQISHLLWIILNLKKKFWNQLLCAYNLQKSVTVPQLLCSLSEYCAAITVLPP